MINDLTPSSPSPNANANASYQTISGPQRSDERFTIMPAGPKMARGSRVMKNERKKEEAGDGREAENEIGTTIFSNLILGWLGLPHALNIAAEAALKGIEVSDEANPQSFSEVAVINADPSKTILPHLSFRNLSVEATSSGSKSAQANAPSWSDKLAEQRLAKQQKGSYKGSGNPQSLTPGKASVPQIPVSLSRRSGRAI